MFVDISALKSPIVVENLLTPYKKGVVVRGVRQPKQKITPEVCREVLLSTNCARNIKDMLDCIAMLPIDEQLPFKDVVLAVFSNREQPHPIPQIGETLAKNSGYLADFEEARKLKEGIIIDSTQYYSASLGVGRNL